MKLKRLPRIAIILGTIAGAAGAQATITWNFNSIYTGGTVPVPGPWYTVTITNAGANTVNFVLTNDLPTSGPYASVASSIFPGELDLFSSIDPKSLTLSNVSAVGLTMNKLSGPDHNLSFEIDYPNGTGHLLPPLGASWTLSGAGLNENSFLGQIPPAILHIQGLPSQNGGSTWAKPGAVPEPASMAALAIGAVTLLARRRRK